MSDFIRKRNDELEDILWAKLVPFDYDEDEGAYYIHIGDKTYYVHAESPSEELKRMLHEL